MVLFAVILGAFLEQIWESGTLEASMIVPFAISLFFIVFPEVRFWKDRKQVKAIQKFIQSLNERA